MPYGEFSQPEQADTLLIVKGVDVMRTVTPVANICFDESGSNGTLLLLRLLPETRI